MKFKNAAQRKAVMCNLNGNRKRLTPPKTTLKLNQDTSKTKLQTVVITKSETNDLINKAKQRYKTTENPQEAGFILNDGSMLDFSGRNEACGYKDSKPTKDDYLRNQRNTDHRDIYRIMNREYSTETMDYFGKKTNAIRMTTYNKDSMSINLYGKPSQKQLTRLRNIYYKGMIIYTDFDYKRTSKGTAMSKEFKTFKEFEDNI